MLAYLNHEATVKAVLNYNQFNPESITATETLIKIVQRNDFPHGWSSTDGLLSASSDTTHAAEQEVHHTLTPQPLYCKFCRVKHDNVWACIGVAKHAQRLLANATGSRKPNSNKKAFSAYPHVYKDSNVTSLDLPALPSSSIWLAHTAATTCLTPCRNVLDDFEPIDGTVKGIESGAASWTRNASCCHCRSSQQRSYSAHTF